jgi:hypothetical protein
MRFYLLQGDLNHEFLFNIILRPKICSVFSQNVKIYINNARNICLFIDFNSNPIFPHFFRSEINKRTVLSGDR